MGLLGTATLRAGGAGGLNVKFNKQTVAGGARAGQRRRTRRLHPHEMFSFCCLVFTFHINIFTTASMLRSHCMFTSQLLFWEAQRTVMARWLPQTTRYFNQKLGRFPDDFCGDRGRIRYLPNPHHHHSTVTM